MIETTFFNEIKMNKLQLITKYPYFLQVSIKKILEHFQFLIIKKNGNWADFLNCKMFVYVHVWILMTKMRAKVKVWCSAMCENKIECFELESSDLLKFQNIRVKEISATPLIGKF